MTRPGGPGPVSDAAPVPLVDRALGAVLTFLVATPGGVLGTAVLASPTTAPTAPGPLLAGTTVGAVAALALAFGGGYARLLVPVEGRRWTVELCVAATGLVVATALVDLVPALTVVWVAIALATALYGTVYAGERVASARDWYDRGAYNWRDDA